MTSGSSVVRTSAKPTVIFLHIPKTAGSTLDKIIEHQYKRTSIFTRAYISMDEFKILPEAHREKIRVLRGHMHFGVHEYLPQSSIYITILRNPIDRVISHYYMVLRSSNNELHNEVVSRNMSLEDFASSGLTGEMENGQTKLLSGLDAFTAGNFQRYSNGNLETAIRNLKERFAVVGLTERFDESLILLKKILGWGNIFYYKRNVGTNRPKKEDIPKEVIRLIEKRNELDVELFEYAKKNFDEAIRQHGPAFQNEVRKFRTMNKLYGKIYGSVYGFVRPMTRGFRRLLRDGRAVCLTVVSMSLFQSAVLALDDIF